MNFLLISIAYTRQYSIILCQNTFRDVQRSGPYVVRSAQAYAILLPQVTTGRGDDASLLQGARRELVHFCDKALNSWRIAKWLVLFIKGLFYLAPDKDI